MVEPLQQRPGQPGGIAARAQAGIGAPYLRDLNPEQREAVVTLDGAVLVDGRPVASWRTAKKGRHLTVKVAAFTDVGLRDLEAEATAVAVHRGCSSVEVVADPGQ